MNSNGHSKLQGMDARVPFGARRCGIQHTPGEDCQPRGGEPSANVLRTEVGGGRRSRELRTEPLGGVPIRRHIRGQDPEGRQAGRPARRAADEVRADHQPQDRQGPRADDSAVAAPASGRDYSVIDRRTFLTAAGAVLLAAPVAAEGQARKAGKIPRIGILSPFSTPSGTSPSFDAFRVGLRESGWIEGRNFTTEYRWAEGKYERLPALAADLVRLKVDVIFSAWSTPAALAAKHAAKTIPIVFVGVGDAVGVGLIESLARPAGNITGATFITEETIGKQLQLLKEAVPRLSRVGTLSNPANPVYGPALKDIEAMGRTLHVEVQCRAPMT